MTRSTISRTTLSDERVRTSERPEDVSGCVADTLLNGDLVHEEWAYQRIKRVSDCSHSLVLYFHRSAGCSKISLVQAYVRIRSEISLLPFERRAGSHAWLISSDTSCGLTNVTKSGGNIVRIPSSHWLVLRELSGLYATSICAPLCSCKCYSLCRQRILPVSPLKNKRVAHTDSIVVTT